MKSYNEFAKNFKGIKEDKIKICYNKYKKDCFNEWLFNFPADEINGKGLDYYWDLFEKTECCEPEIYTQEQWNKDIYFKAKEGQEIERDIYIQFLESMPPLDLPTELKAKYSKGFLNSEPYEHREVNGKLKAFYLAFGRKGDRYYYLGKYTSN